MLKFVEDYSSRRNKLSRQEGDESVAMQCKMQYICRALLSGLLMSRMKDETLSIRTSSEIKQLLRAAAERERRSVASMIEILVVDYANAHDLALGRLDNDLKKEGD